MQTLHGIRERRIALAQQLGVGLGQDQQGRLGHLKSAGIKAVRSEGVVAKLIAGEGQATDGCGLRTGVGTGKRGGSDHAELGEIASQHPVEAEAGEGVGGAVVGLGIKGG